MWSAIWTNATVATMSGPVYGLIADGAVAVEAGRIAWVGPIEQLPAPPLQLASQVHDLGGCVITPGLVDAHTHIVHAGTRWREFEMRAGRASPAQIVRAGGGMSSTVAATRAASHDELYAQSEIRARALICSGVTTVESKSGYGLDLETELRILRVSRDLGQRLPLTVVSTFLGAHAVGPEFAGRPDDYIEFLCSTVLPAAMKENLVDHVDGFCDQRGFTHRQITRLLSKAKANGLAVKLHADQYADFGAGALAARLGALSADHLENASTETVAAMAVGGTVATLLPGAGLTQTGSARPPVAQFRRTGVPMAIATNCNPGSSPTTSPMTMMNMACHLFGMSADEALAGFTRNAAMALALDDDIGTIEVGKAADLAIWDVSHPSELSYYIGDNRCSAVIKAGEEVFRHDVRRCQQWPHR